MQSNEMKIIKQIESAEQEPAEQEPAEQEPAEQEPAEQEPEQKQEEMAEHDEDMYDSDDGYELLYVVGKENGETLIGTYGWGIPRPLSEFEPYLTQKEMKKLLRDKSLNHKYKGVIKK